MTGQAASSSELVMCPACGAVVAPQDRACWLCHRNLSEETIEAELVQAPEFAHSTWGVRAALIIGIVLLGVVTVGAFLAAPGVGVLLGLVFVVAVFAAAKSWQAPDPVAGDQLAVRSAYASPSPEPAARSPSPLFIVLQVLGIVALIGLASIIALFTFCAIVIFAAGNM